MATIDIPDDWKPTQESLDALPLPLRRYMQLLATDCDPQGTIRQNILLKAENEMLRKECERLAGINDGDI